MADNVQVNGQPKMQISLANDFKACALWFAIGAIVGLIGAQYLSNLWRKTK